MKLFSKIRQRIFVLFDLILINVAFLLAIEFRFLKETTDFGYTQIYLENALQITLIYLAVFYASRVYKLVFTQKMWDEIRYCFIANLIAPVIVFLYAIVFTDRLPYSVYFLTMIIATYLTVGLRIGMALGFQGYRRIKYGAASIHKSKVVVLGAGEAARNVIEEMKDKRRYEVVAVLDDANSKKGKFIAGAKVVGRVDDIEKTVINYDIDEIYFCIKSMDAEKKRYILKRCTATGAKVKTIPSVYDIIDENVTISHIKNVDIDDLLQRNPANLNMESISELINDKVVLITGAGGSIGSELIRQMLRFKPQKLVLVDTYENTTYELFCEIKRKKPDLQCDVVIGSVANKKEIDDIVGLHKPSVVLHAAAHKHVPLMENNPVRAFNNNVVGTKNVALAAEKHGVEKFVMISSDKAVRPTNIMGATKRIAEMIIVNMNENSNCVFTSVRFGNVLGSHGSVIPLFENQIKDGGPVTVTHPEVTRYFMTIPEASQLVLQAGALAKGGEIFMLDMGTPIKIDTLARNMIKLCGFEPDTDIKIVYTGLRPGEKMFEELSFSEETVTNTPIDKIFCLKTYESLHKDAMDVVGDMEKIGNDQQKMRKAIWNIVPKHDENGNRDIADDISVKTERK